MESQDPRSDNFFIVLDLLNLLLLGVLFLQLEQIGVAELLGLKVVDFDLLLGFIESGYSLEQLLFALVDCAC